MTEPYFESHFGLINPDGSENTHKTNDISSNVVSVLQAGAFFGALGSAPMSGTFKSLFFFCFSSPLHPPSFSPQGVG